MRQGIRKSRLAAIFGLLALLFALAPAARAHEIRPALIQITEFGPGRYDVVWKQPMVGDMTIHMVPHLSSGVIDKDPTREETAPGFALRTWRVTGGPPLDGQTVGIEGLGQTVTDVLMRVTTADGKVITEVIRPSEPSRKIALTAPHASANQSFFTLGVEHILKGPDHLLFVLGLLLIVGGRAKLIKTITAFTVAHSITLAIATLGGVTLSIPLLNTLIALSILFLGAEVLRARNGGTSLTIRHPWAAAFGFGLLHGFGFAGGLMGLGLDKGALAMALLLFNLGVEAGQLAFIAAVLGLQRAFKLMDIRWSKPLAALPTYAVGGLGAFWTLQYAMVLFARGS